MLLFGSRIADENNQIGEIMMNRIITEKVLNITGIFFNRLYLLMKLLRLIGIVTI